MKIHIEKKYTLIPILYAAIIAFFLFMHFSGNNTFNHQFGNLVVSGTVPSNGDGTSNHISDAVIECDGIQFHFGNGHNITIENSDGTVRNANLRTYTLFPDGIELRFEHAVVLRFISEGSVNNKISIHSRIAENQDRVGMVHIPYTTDDGISTSVTKGIPVLTIRHEEGTSFLAMSNNSIIDQENKRLSLKMADGELPRIVIERPATNHANAYAYWFLKGTTVQVVENYGSVVSSFVDKAYTGWRTRYNSQRRSWQLSGGETGFDERLLTAVLAEALRRGEFNAVFSEVRNGITNFTNQLTLLSAPFLGNLSNAAEDLQEQDLQRVQEIERLLRDNNPVLFTQPNLISFIVNHGPFSLINEVFRLAETIDAQSISPEECLGLIQTYNQLTISLPEAEEIFSQLAAEAQKRILSMIIKNSEGFYLKKGGTEIDLRYSLLAGKQLALQGARDKKQVIESIGKQLMVSALSLTDEQGFLPETARFTNNATTQSSENIAPEELYHLIIDNPYYPHETSLYKAVGPGSWIWGIAQFSVVQSESDTLSVEIDFPVDATHHFILQGIQPFTQIEMHGIPWRSDPTYERYSTGWVYDGGTQTLYAKLTHRVENEMLVINF